MPPRNKSFRPMPLDRDSEVRPIVDRHLPVVNHLSYVHPDLVQKILDELKKARLQVEGVLTNDNGQGILFSQEDEDEVRIPERLAKDIVQLAQSSLTGRGVRLEITNNSIRIVAGETDDDDPYHESGY